MYNVRFITYYPRYNQITFYHAVIAYDTKTGTTKKLYEYFSINNEPSERMKKYITEKHNDIERDSADNIVGLVYRINR